MKTYCIVYQYFYVGLFPVFTCNNNVCLWHEFCRLQADTDELSAVSIMRVLSLNMIPTLLSDSWNPKPYLLE